MSLFSLLSGQLDRIHSEILQTTFQNAFIGNLQKKKTVTMRKMSLISIYFQYLNQNTTTEKSLKNSLENDRFGIKLKINSPNAI